VTTTTRLTLDEFLALPDIEERRLELIDGEVHEKMSPRWGHGALALELGFALRAFGFVATEARAVIPDAPSWGPSAPLPDLSLYKGAPPKSEEWMTRPPDLVVELLSVGQSRTEMRAKAAVYIQFGVPCIWVFDLERQTVDIYEAGERRTLTTADTLTSATLPGFAERIGELFARAGFELEA
jgi:Uma2 family endonuclease